MAHPLGPIPYSGPAMPCSLSVNIQAPQHWERVGIQSFTKIPSRSIRPPANPRQRTPRSMPRASGPVPQHISSPLSRARVSVDHCTYITSICPCGGQHNSLPHQINSSFLVWINNKTSGSAPSTALTSSIPPPPGDIVKHRAFCHGPRSQPSLLAGHAQRRHGISLVPVNPPTLESKPRQYVSCPPPHCFAATYHMHERRGVAQLGQ